MLNYKEYVYAVYQERNFTKAAQKLHTSQPWLSVKIKEIEKALGTPLFDRSTVPLSLTEAGSYYIEHIEKVMKIEEEMTHYFDRLRWQCSDELHIGSSNFFCTYVLPVLISDFRAEHPDIKLTSVCGNTDHLTSLLISGELDLIFSVEKPEHKEVITIPWATKEIILAVPAKFEINKKLSQYMYSFTELRDCQKNGKQKPFVRLSQFANEKFLLLDESNDIHARSLEMCQKAGFNPQIEATVTHMMTTYYLVCEGRGITLISSSIVDHVSPIDNVVFYRVDDPLATRNVYLSYSHREESDLLACLMKYLLNMSGVHKGNKSSIRE